LTAYRAQQNRNSKRYHPTETPHNIPQTTINNKVLSNK
jgi:hypothetical protein